MMYTIQHEFPMCVFVSIAMGWTFVLFSTSHWDGLLPGSATDTMNGVSDKKQDKTSDSKETLLMLDAYSVLSNKTFLLFFLGGGELQNSNAVIPWAFLHRVASRAIGLHAIWQPGSPMGRMKGRNLRTGNHGCLVGGLEHFLGFSHHIGKYWE